MSVSSHDLQELRSELDGINQQLIDLVKVRRNVVTQIQKQKPRHGGSFASYDSEREWSLFVRLKPQLEQLTLKELLAFSLLMEEQAGAPVRYPEWSETIHLVSNANAIEHRLNPLLVKLLWPAQFEALNLSAQFSFLRSI